MKTPLLAISIFSSSALVATLAARPDNRPPPPPPEDVVVEMFSDYDSDENNGLNQAELIAAFNGIRENHRAAMQQNRPRKNPTWNQGNATDRPMGPPRGKGRGPIPPETMVPNLIEDFDSNGDAELNTEELLAAITFLHSQPRPGRGRAPQTATPQD